MNNRRRALRGEGISSEDRKVMAEHVIAILGSEHEGNTVDGLFDAFPEEAERVCAAMREVSKGCKHWKAKTLALAPTWEELARWRAAVDPTESAGASLGFLELEPQGRGDGALALRRMLVQRLSESVPTSEQDRFGGLFPWIDGASALFSAADGSVSTQALADDSKLGVVFYRIDTCYDEVIAALEKDWRAEQSLPEHETTPPQVMIELAQEVARRFCLKIDQLATADHADIGPDSLAVRVLASSSANRAIRELGAKAVAQSQAADTSVRLIRLLGELGIFEIPGFLGNECDEVEIEAGIKQWFDENLGKGKVATRGGSNEKLELGAAQIESVINRSRVLHSDFTREQIQSRGEESARCYDTSHVRFMFALATAATIIFRLKVREEFRGANNAVKSAFAGPQSKSTKASGRLSGHQSAPIERIAMLIFRTVDKDWRFDAGAISAYSKAKSERLELQMKLHAYAAHGRSAGHVQRIVRFLDR